MDFVHDWQCAMVPLNTDKSRLKLGKIESSLGGDKCKTVVRILKSRDR